MHRDETDIGPEGHIHIDGITKMEGHGSVDIRIRDGKVKYAKLSITESKRFYTEAIVGKPALSLPLMTSRVCGTCSIAHLTCCAEAVENAVGYKPSEQTLLLRELSLYGMMIRDHAMHLYLFCLPDIYGKDSVLDFDDSQNDVIKKAFEVKSAGNNLSKAVGGRAIHETYAQVGRFSHVPDKDSVKKVVDELKDVREHALEFVGIFHKSAFKLERDTDFLSLLTDDYAFRGGNVVDSRGETVPEGRYWDYVDKVVIPYSEATGYSFEGREFMVGALARMNLNRDRMCKSTLDSVKDYIGVFPSKNIFHNNLAQAIEVVHSIDRSIELLESHDFREETPEPVVIRQGEGVGMLEAPRGTLYYMLSVNKQGKIGYGRIIVPTQQNQITMERAIGELVEQNIDLPKDKIVFEIEKLIRAYDPCMSCASHFLKVKWS